MWIQKLLSEIGGYLGFGPVVIAVLAAIIAAGYWRFRYRKDELAGKEGRKEVADRLAHHGKLREAYFAYLSGGLGKIDSFLGPSPWSARRN